jgi:hypothetical protein
MRADPDEHVGEVVAGIDAGQPAGLSEREDHGGGASPAGAAGEQPIPAADSDRPDGPLASIMPRPGSCRVQVRLR